MGATETGVKAGYALGTSKGLQNVSSAGISFSCQENFFPSGCVALFPVIDFSFLTQSEISGWIRKKPVFALLGGVGVRVVPADFVSLTFDCKFGCGSYLTTEDKTFLVLKAGISCDFPIFSSDGFGIMLSPAFDYMRTPYSDVFIFGAGMRIESK